MNAIEAKGLVKRYKNITAVDGLDLEIKRGELYALLGVNGAGKTTAIRMLSCLTKPSHGDARVGGYRIHGFSREMTQDKIMELTTQFTLQSVLGRKAGKLSGGWQRRVSIAMALISQPQILFLDEPTLGLDVLARHELWTVIRALKGKTTVVLTTHYMEEAAALSDRVGIMKDGRLLASGTVEELKKMAGAADFEQAFVSIVKEG